MGVGVGVRMEVGVRVVGVGSVVRVGAYGCALVCLRVRTQVVPAMGPQLTAPLSFSPRDPGGTIIQMKEAQSRAVTLEDAVKSADIVRRVGYLREDRG